MSKFPAKAKNPWHKSAGFSGSMCLHATKELLNRFDCWWGIETAWRLAKTFHFLRFVNWKLKLKTVAFRQNARELLLKMLTGGDVLLTCLRLVLCVLFRRFLLKWLTVPFAIGRWSPRRRCRSRAGRKRGERDLPRIKIMKTRTKIKKQVLFFQIQVFLYN